METDPEKDTLQSLEECQNDTDEDSGAADPDDFAGTCVLMIHV
jgi:hypothetical protein